MPGVMRIFISVTLGLWNRPRIGWHRVNVSPETSHIRGIQFLWVSIYFSGGRSQGDFDASRERYYVKPKNTFRTGRLLK